METSGFEKWITGEIERFAREDPSNRLERLDGTRIFGTPLVGFVSGDDPIFVELKEAVGPFHLTPREAAQKAAKGRGMELPPGQEIGVVSYVLPIAENTRRENAQMTDFPSERWAHTRLYGEAFNRKLEEHLVSVLAQDGQFALAPEIERDLFSFLDDERVGWASTWSQRHVAYAANLGTFGLSDGLITESGKAHRLGSVITDKPLKSRARAGDIHRDCRYYNRDGDCDMCIQRCPCGAITENGHDKKACFEFVMGTVPKIKELYGIDIYACGLCQTGVRCECKIPAPG